MGGGGGGGGGGDGGIVYTTRCNIHWKKNQTYKHTQTTNKIVFSFLLLGNPCLFNVTCVLFNHHFQCTSVQLLQSKHYNKYFKHAGAELWQPQVSYPASLSKLSNLVIIIIWNI